MTPFSLKDHTRFLMQKIILIYILNCRIIDIFIKLIHIQPDLLGDFYDFVLIYLFVDFKQLIMKLPEFSLAPGSQSCYSRCGGILVTAKRKIFKYHGYRVWIFLEHLLEERRKPRTVRSLKIAEHGNDHRSTRIALPW